MNKPPIPSNTIICAFKNHSQLHLKYPKRSVQADRYCPNDEFYYFKRDGHVRCVKMDDWSVWAQVWEDGFPTIYQKKIWPKPFPASSSE